MIFPKQQPIYYIYAPSYTEKSAGVKALYLLCHFLNERGEKAFIIPMDGVFTPPFLKAPSAASHLNDWHAVVESGIDYIMIYPEIIRGNPFCAKKVVRYCLAYPGAYGGEKEFKDTDKVWSYTTRIARSTKSPQNVLCLPVTDLTKYKDPIATEPRSGSCFYSNKYDKIHGNTFLPITENSKRLEGTQDEMIKILQTSEVCYVYENTTVIVEAQLCGCPVVMIRTPYFYELHSAEDFGTAGVRWNDEQATDSIVYARRDYKKVCDRFDVQLSYFIKDTGTW